MSSVYPGADTAANFGRVLLGALYDAFCHAPESASK